MVILVLVALLRGVALRAGLGIFLGEAVDNRIHFLQFYASLLDGEPPAHFGLSFVTGCFPCLALASDELGAVHASGQAVTAQDAPFPLRHVPPTAVLGRMVGLQTVAQRLGAPRRKYLIHRPSSVRVQVVA